MCISISFCLVSIRFSWRVRRKSRPAGNGRQPSGTSGRGHGRETGKSYGPVQRSNVQRSDTRPHPVRLHSIPERPKSQKGREREPPVVIGDPTDMNALVQESTRRRSSRMSTRQFEAATPNSSRQSMRHSIRGPDDIPSQNSLDLRTIPLIPQEDPEDILLTPSPRQSRSPSQSRPSSHPNTPTYPPPPTLFHP